MTKKETFINIVQTIVFDQTLDEWAFSNKEWNDALDYFESLKNEPSKSSTKEITENGLKILTWMQENQEKEDNAFTAKSIAEGLFTSGRSVAGSMKKLVNDEFVKKLGGNPAMYALTEKGQEYKQS